MHLPMARAIAIRQHAEHARRAVRAAVTGVQAKNRRRAVLASLLIILSMGGTVGLLTNFGRTPRAAYGQERSGAHAQSNAATVPRSGGSKLLPATAPPAPAPPTLAKSAPLRAHEVFGFAPYWTLSQSGGFNVSGISTLAYFSIDVNADGSLDKSGAGSAGYQSLDLANLVTRAHGAGDRVVLTVSCFDQRSLDQITSSPTAGATLATALIAAMKAKNLDGVNLDFEGEGSADQAGLTRLVTQVSTAIHAVNPHYQVTMDTYASSAGDPNGFYDIPALAPAVDGFFVMEYQLNLQSGPSPVSPLTSTMFSDRTTIHQYSEPHHRQGDPRPAVFRHRWPTTNGSFSATATGPAADVTYGQVMANGHPVYWDATTEPRGPRTRSATSGMRPSSKIRRRCMTPPTRGCQQPRRHGVWALGMDGNDPTVDCSGRIRSRRQGRRRRAVSHRTDGAIRRSGGPGQPLQRRRRRPSPLFPKRRLQRPLRRAPRRRWAPFPRLHGYLAGAFGSPHTVSSLQGAASSIRSPLRSSDRLCHQ